MSYRAEIGGRSSRLDRHACQLTGRRVPAEDAARRIAKRIESEAVTHRPNGQIRDKDSFGNDSQRTMTL